MVEEGEIQACKEQHQLVKFIRNCFESENIYTDDEQLERYLSLARYFPFERIFEWQEFCIALHLCTYRKKDGRPRFPRLFIMGGRGLGKDGFIALESMALVSPYNPIKKYDVDICANNEEQAMRPLKDVLEVLDDTQNYKKLIKHFYWTKEWITGLKYGGTIKGRTNNAKTKDGMRSGMVVFNELHQYENYAQIKVFKTGKGKVAHPRELYVTTNGDVREGPLDDMITDAVEILKTGENDNGLLPFICRLDDKKEADDSNMWNKANPSLPYMPDLFTEIHDEYIEWKKNPIANSDFMTKRMNLPQTDAEVAITDWENILATNRELPDMTGWSCVCGIDYASINDFASVVLLFKKADIYYCITHSWLCLQSKDLWRIKAPWREWVELGMITAVDEVEISPELIGEWIVEQSQRYHITKVAVDNFRYALLKSMLKKIGFENDSSKNIKFVRLTDVVKVVPVVESVFSNKNFVWGDCPVLRWAANNVKVIKYGAKLSGDIGNRMFGKIEGKSRKTDPFQALAHAMTIEDELDNGEGRYHDIPVIIV